MKKNNFNVLIAAFMLFGSFCYAQVSTNDLKLKERMANKVEIFSPKEKDSIQIWFYNRTSKLGMSPQVREKYTQIMTDNAFDMTRLSDKDKGYNKKEQLEQLEVISNKINTSVRPLLNDNQYEKHLANYEIIYDLIIKRVKEE